MKRVTDPDALLLQGAADPSRLTILRRLAAAGTEVCVCEFTPCCDIAQPTVSHHLKVLRESGWVTSERRGSWVYYRIRAESVERFGALAGEFGGIGSPAARHGAPRGMGAAGRTLPVLEPG